MRKKLQAVMFLGALAGAALAPSGANAETYHLNLVHSSTVQGTEVKAGGHKMDLKDGQLTIQNGKQMLEVPIIVEEADQTFRSSSVVYKQDRGKYSIEEIQLGGTKTRLVFNSGISADRVK
jgi:hypothetical protein